MTEANSNANSVHSQTNQESVANSQQQEGIQEEALATADYSSNNNPDITSSNTNTSNSKMDWQQVAHKLREYNRKLLKKMLRLEQELADIDNKFNKYIEKSRNSDLLVAQQEAEIQKYQEQIAIFSEQLTTSQGTIAQKSTRIEQLLEESQSAQRQTAQLERECTLLQEKYDRQVYELNVKEKNNQELQAKLSQQQRNALQYQAELKRYRDRQVLSDQPHQQPVPEIPRKKASSSPASRSIQPWSTANSEPKITLPNTKIQPPAIANPLKPSETVKTAAEIATWSVAQQTSNQTSNKSQKQLAKTTKTHQSQTSASKKPQSLAAVDLPTFPRP